MSERPESNDLVIVGGGMVGAALALDFGRRGWRVGLVEEREPAAVTADTPYGIRVSALNRRSEVYLDDLGAWGSIRATRACPYERLAVWDDDRPARVEFQARELGPEVDHLGHIVENDLIQWALWEQLGQLPSVTPYTPAAVAGLEPAPLGATVRLEDGRRLHGRLVIAADGARSRLRQAAGIPIDVHDYRQSAVVADVRTQLPQQSITWQRFADEGPQAFLPLVGQRASLVWYMPPERARRLAQGSPEELAEAVTSAFPSDLGGIDGVVQQASFPIRAQHARYYSAPGVVLVGDAAHTIHPLAGQGVNLGFRDAQALVRHVTAAAEAGTAPDDPSVLSAYARERRRDNQLMQSAMTAIREAFATRCGPLPWLRQAGLWVAQNAGPAKRLALRYASDGALL